MNTIHHVLDIGAQPSEVHKAIATQDGLAGWWSTRVNADGKEGSVVDFTFAESFNPDMLVTTEQEPSLVEWRCVSGHDPWQDSTFRFEIVEAASGSLLRFTQGYSIEVSDDAFGIYNFNWGYYLQSLKDFCETGAGKPFKA